MIRGIDRGMDARSGWTRERFVAGMMSQGRPQSWGVACDSQIKALSQHEVCMLIHGMHADSCTMYVHAFDKGMIKGPLEANRSSERQHGRERLRLN